MTTVFCRVTADLSEQFVQVFPHQFDFQGLLQKIADDAGVAVSSSDSRIQNDTAYSLQGLWPEMEKAYNLLTDVYGSVTAIRCEHENSVAQGSGSFSALVEAAEAISRGADLQQQVGTDIIPSKDAINKSFSPKDASQTVSIPVLQETKGVTDNNKMQHNILNENFTKVKDFRHKSFDLYADAEIPSAGYRNKHISSVLKDPVQDRANENNKLILEDSRTSQFKGSNTLRLQYDHVPGSDEESEVDMKKSVPVKKRQTRGTVQKMEQQISSPLNGANEKKAKPSQSKAQVTAGQEEISNKTELESLKNDQDLEIEKPAKVRDATTQFHDSKEQYSCEFCDFVGKNRKAFSDHTQRIHLSKPSKCDICNKVFPNERYMKRHRDSHGGPNHRCDQCGKMYKVQKALRNHIKRHDASYKPPEFKCDMCDKSFCNNYILDCHKKSEHLGIKKSFLCSTCGKSFTTKHTLQQHVNVHTGTRPYKCEKCDKSFSYESALRDHKFIHEGTKKFICSDPSCKKAFRQRSALKMHEKIHKDEKDFICKECGRGFTQKQALDRHIRAHKGYKPFWCKICLRSFGDAAIIRRHMILVHKIHKDPTQWREDIVEKVYQETDDEEECNPKTPTGKEGNNLGNTTEGHTETDPVISAAEVANQSNFKTQIVTTQTKIPVHQTELLPISEISKYKTVESQPFQVLQIQAADHHHQIHDFAGKDETLISADESPEDLAMHYPTVSVLSTSTEHAPPDVLNYEYIVTPDDAEYQQLARTSDIDQTTCNYVKTSVVGTPVSKHHGRSDIFDSSNFTLANTTAVSQLTDSVKELTLPEVSSVLAGTSSQDDLMMRSPDQMKVRQHGQDMLSAERVMDITKQLQETDPTAFDSQQLQILYSYYSAVASQYLNMAQYSTVVPTSDSDPH